MKNSNDVSKTIEESSANFLIEAKFQFKTLNEAYSVANFLSTACPNPRLVIVGLSEMFINGIEHGNLGITYEEKTKLQEEDNWIPEIERRLKLPENLHKFVEVEFKKTPSEIRIKVTDQGNGFDWRKFKKLDHEHRYHVHGRGIPLAQSLVFENLQFSEKGNEVTCVIPLENS